MGSARNARGIHMETQMESIKIATRMGSAQNAHGIHTEPHMRMGSARNAHGIHVEWRSIWYPVFGCPWCVAAST